MKIGEIKFCENKTLEYKNSVIKDEAIKLVMVYCKSGWPKNI